MKTLLLFLLPLTTFGQTSFESPFSVLINDGEVDVYHHRVMVNMTPSHVSIGVNDESTPPFTGVVERVEELTNTTMYYLDGAVVKHERFNGFNGAFQEFGGGIGKHGADAMVNEPSSFLRNADAGSQFNGTDTFF